MDDVVGVGGDVNGVGGGVDPALGDSTGAGFVFGVKDIGS